MVLVISKSEHRSLWPRTSHDVIPIALHEVCADTMDLVEAFDVADGKLVWGHSDVRPILLMERVDIGWAAAGHDCYRKGQPCEVRVPRAGHGFQWTGKSAIH